MQEPMIGIHHRPGSYSDRWIKYCQERKVSFRIVNGFSSDVLKEVKDLYAFLWHWPHYDYASSIAARSVIYALELTGLAVYPDTKTCCHYDDKLAQKYLLEAVQAPLASTWVFYTLGEALQWVKEADFPKVFKLRKGAGSSNVRLVKTVGEARRLCHIAFSSGFSPIRGYLDDIGVKVRRTQAQRAFWQKLKRAPEVIREVTRRRRSFPPERDYVYFQEYYPGNDYDTRIIVVGERAYGGLRFNRPGDFRASGSGDNDRRRESVDLRLVEEGFKIAKSIHSQSLAMDFVYDAQHNPVLLEVSYAFAAEGPHDNPGHWDSNLVWHPGQTWPQDLILEDILNSLSSKLYGL